MTLAYMQNKKILVVDYNPAVRHLLEKALMHAGFHVLSASDTDEAWFMFDHAHPDLISLDLIRSGPDGFRFLHTLRTRRDSQDIPLLVMTSTSSEPEGNENAAAYMSRRILSGPGVYLETALTADAFVDVVNKILELPLDEVERLSLTMKKQLAEIFSRFEKQTPPRQTPRDVIPDF